MRAARNPLVLMATVGLFAIWGFAHQIYAAIGPQFAAFFQLTGSEAALSQSMFTVSLLALAIPAALFLRRFGYKLGVVFGLSSFSVGALLLYPAIDQHEYIYFLGAVIVLGAGWAWLETSANPLIVSLGSPDTAVRRLNFAQSFYPIGVVLGYEVGKRLTQMDLSQAGGQMAQTAVRPYVIVGLCVLFVAFLIENLDFPPVATERTGKDTRAREELRTLLSRPTFRIGAAAIAAYIFAHVVLWSVTLSYARQVIPAASGMTAANVITWSFVVYGIGRFAGTALMYRFEPNRLFAVCAGACVVLTAAAVVIGGLPGIFCVVATNFFMSIMYPTIFATTIRGLGHLTKAASGLLVAAMGVAASLAPIALNAIVTLTSIQFAVILPALSFGFLLVYSGAVRRAQPCPPSAAQHARPATQQ